MNQTPDPGARLLMHRGDTLEFRFSFPGEASGSAWLRTNLGSAATRRREIIAHVEHGATLRDRDWHDLPMQADASGSFSLTLPLLEVGVFRAKCFFLPAGSDEPVWPEGDNTSIKVEPSEFCCSSSLYTAFVRQFGPNCEARQGTAQHTEAVALLDEAGYTVIPSSGTFRNLASHLDHIMGRLGFRILQLLPIHPTPTTYARMGRFGSPFAALDLMDIDPALAEFDRKTTPLDQFRELIDGVHRRGGFLFMDMPINHTGWASHLQVHHPDWFVRGRDDAFRSPGAWGVTWEDLSELDFSHHGLWEHMADVFLAWCRHGVDGFRCDAGYMVPLPVWEYIVAKVREGYPDTVFLLEGLGGRVEVMSALLDDAGLNWAYSELFQNYDRDQITAYLPGCLAHSHTRGNLLNFAETHDNDRLAAKGHAYARLRTALAALASHEGGFGITSGVEWFAVDKVNVHGAASLNWGAEPHQVDVIARLNRLLDTHPAFHAGATVELIDAGPGNGIGLRRAGADGSHPLLVLANLSADTPFAAAWPAALVASDDVVDMLTDSPVDGSPDAQGLCRLELEPHGIVCLGISLTREGASPDTPPAHERARQQRARAKVLEFINGNCGCAVTIPGGPARATRAISEARLEALSASLAEDPMAFCRTVQGTDFVAVTRWAWPDDTRRCVPVPHGHALLLEAPVSFSARLEAPGEVLDHERSLPRRDGGHFILFRPCHASREQRPANLHLSVHDADATQHVEAPVLLLAPDEPTLTRHLTPAQAEPLENHVLLTNGRGAIAQVRTQWGRLFSQYDALLAANLHDAVPVDRHIMFTRCRGWLVYRGYSVAIDNRNLVRIERVAQDGIAWHFELPCGLGKLVPLALQLHLPRESNAVELSVRREAGHAGNSFLEDSKPVRIVLRPDIDDRTNHGTTKAFAGPEANWADQVTPLEDGFRFRPHEDRLLTLALPDGRFVVEPEWDYMVELPWEKQRGFEGATDLFSPGYFDFNLEGGQARTLSARSGDSSAPPAPERLPQTQASSNDGMAATLTDAIREFIVHRDDSRTVIAGYPWFLDWGRDTLICLRGMIAAGLLDESRDILHQFARFEQNGTLPNMIRGEDDSDRDTSDAPLWFLVACRDLWKASGDPALLDMPCGDRPLRDVLRSIVNGYSNGTPNGIRMDPGSGLIYSPSHFTWMDTNFPAGSPRQGYPIEIQALWFAGLSFMGEFDDSQDWAARARRVSESILTCFSGHAWPYLSDCLLATPGTPAHQAVPDDALRPNQLFAITLGAISDNRIAPAILDATSRLLVPGGIRSLADQPVQIPLPIHRDGVLMNDPAHPYCGTYGGDEDTSRKLAYHNGTVWTWPFASYSEALFRVYGDDARASALSLLGSSRQLLQDGCWGHLPEILDGDAPHAQRGCGAQAWSVTELLRVRKLLEN